MSDTSILGPFPSKAGQGAQPKDSATIHSKDASLGEKKDTEILVSNKGQPLISVIITNYNYQEFLHTSIKSVIDQTYKNVECIVVDDGSTDDSRSIIEQYRNIKSIFKMNGGQGSAIKAGVDIASGDIIISLDADDFLYPQACRTIADNWQTGILCLNYKLDVFHHDKKTEYYYPMENFVIDNFKFLNKYGYYPSAPMSGNAFDAAYISFILDNATCLDNNGVDAYLLYCAPALGKGAFVDMSLGGYRRHGNNISMSSFKKTENNLSEHIYYQYWAQQNFQRFARKRNLPVKQRKYVLGAYNRMWQLWVADGDSAARKIPCGNRRILCVLTAYSFAFEPGIELKTRFKNICYSVLSIALPKAARLTIQRRFMEYG